MGFGFRAYGRRAFSRRPIAAALPAHELCDVPPPVRAATGRCAPCICCAHTSAWPKRAAKCSAESPAVSQKFPMLIGVSTGTYT